MATPRSSRSFGLDRCHPTVPLSDTELVIRWSHHEQLFQTEVQDLKKQNQTFHLVRNFFYGINFIIIFAFQLLEGPGILTIELIAMNIL